FFLPRSGRHQDLHSFPTRRSSDLRRSGSLRMLSNVPNKPLCSCWFIERTPHASPSDGGEGGERPGRGSAPNLNFSSANPHSCQRSEEHTSELQSRGHLVCRLLLEK